MTGPADLSSEALSSLSAWLASALPADAVRIDAAARLAGGAVQRHWRLDCDVAGGPLSGARTLVLRADPDIPLRESIDKAREHALLMRLHGESIPVPVPRAVCLDRSVIGRSFLICDFLPGTAERAALAARPDNAALLGDLAAALAALHRLPPGPDQAVSGPAARVAQIAGWDDLLAAAPPAVGQGLDWLAANAPTDGFPASLHRDFRTGNFLVAEGRLTAILDWEFAGAGDPHEDLGWFTAACWRPDAPSREAGGLGDLNAFLAAYAAAGGRPVDPERLRFWQVFAHLRWALIAAHQGLRAEAGEGPRHELEEAVARVPGLADDIARLTA